MHKKVEISTGFDRAKDFIVNGKHVELKTHVKAARTGNVALEHQSNRTHLAPTSLHLIPTWYWIPRSIETELIRDPKFWVPGGDDKRILSLVPIDSEEFKNNFKRL